MGGGFFADINQKQAAIEIIPTRSGIVAYWISPFPALPKIPLQWIKTNLSLNKCTAIHFFPIVKLRNIIKMTIIILSFLQIY